MFIPSGHVLLLLLLGPVREDDIVVIITVVRNDRYVIVYVYSKIKYIIMQARWQRRK